MPLFTMIFEMPPCLIFRRYAPAAAFDALFRFSSSEDDAFAAAAAAEDARFIYAPMLLMLAAERHATLCAAMLMRAAFCR